jgi:hypothetical protein
LRFAIDLAENPGFAADATIVPRASSLQATFCATILALPAEKG